MTDPPLSLPLQLPSLYIQVCGGAVLFQNKANILLFVNPQSNPALVGEISFKLAVKFQVNGMSGLEMTISST
jgi:hypothetical protein